MRAERRLIAVAAGVLLAATGCLGTADPEPTSTQTPTITESPSAMPSPTPSTESELAAANAERLVREYYRVTDAVAADPDKQLEPLDAVSTSVDLLSWQGEFRNWQRDGWIQHGTSAVVDFVAQGVSLDNSAPDNGVVPTVQVDVCVDVSEVDVVGPDGRSVVAADRPDRSWERLWVSNYDYEADPDGGWRVADAKGLEQEPCVG